MTLTKHKTRRFRATRAVAIVITVGLLATPARGQDAPTRESAAAIKAVVLGDLEVLRGKFVGLAEAFPAEKYTWRPMDGVRSVSEVLMLIASEGYGLVPATFGGKPALP